MTTLSTLLLGLVMGLIFGFVLEKSRVIDPKMIIGQFQLRKFVMLKVFLSAIATGLLIFAIFFTLGFDRLSWKSMVVPYDIAGGLLLGLGIALAGACPGTVFAQIGGGYKDAWVTLLGAICGALFYAKITPILPQVLGSPWPKEKITLDVSLGLPFWAIALGLIFCITLCLYLIERKFPWRQDL
jgi:uncharacterized protein